MTTLRKAAQQALKSLEDAIKMWTEEPVAWMCSDEELLHKGYSRFSKTCVGEWNIPVYTHPLKQQAAPDLLAALIKTAALLHPDLPEHKAARAAIAQALGEKE